MTRSRRCLSALVHGRRATPSERTPRASASAAASSCGTESVCSASVSAPSRRRRRARNDAEARSKLSSSTVSIEAPAIRSMSSSVSAAARRMRAEAARPAISPMARNGSPGQRVMRLQRRRPAVGHQELAAPAARDSDAVGIGGGEEGADWSSQRHRPHPRPGLDGRPDRPFPSGEGEAKGLLAASPRARRRASSARCERSRRKASIRVARSTASPPSPRSVSTTAISLAILASPSRAASTTMRARRGGSARLAIARPSSVMRPSPSMAPIAVRSARASFSAARGGGSRKASLRRIGDAPKRAIERKPGEIGGENFRRGVRLKPAVRGLLPQTIADAGLGAPRAPAPLIGVGPAHADCLEARKPDVGLIDRDAHEPAVDDDAHASIVSDVSAIEVASTILRRPAAAGAMARSCARLSSAP